MRQIFSKVRGTCDFFPPQSFTIEEIFKKARSIFKIYGYEEIILPHLEEFSLFKKGVGEVTDIVQHQMFRIQDKDIVLRPEGTAQVVRAYLEHNLPKKADFYKFFYIGTMFRGERPQKGRLREFHHIGAEVIGSKSPYIDFEVIDVSIRILYSVKVKNFTLRINSIGCKKDRERFAYKVQKEAERQKHTLCSICQNRLYSNPLRILDCKRIECREFRKRLSLGMEHLCRECKEHFQQVLHLLDKFGISYIHDRFLVRGLDYYTNTVFEFTTDKLGAQDALGGGGRYDDLIYNLGGIKIPALGFSLGLERILLSKADVPPYRRVEVLVAYTSKEVYNEAYILLQKLRKEGISADIDYNERSLKAQLKQAQRGGVLYVVIVGDEEVRREKVILRDMSRSLQEEVDKKDVMFIVSEKLGEGADRRRVGL